MTTLKTKTVAYIRVSSIDQADNGHSLAAQREKVAMHARLHDLDLVAVISRTPACRPRPWIGPA